jgi:hypothetical protein
MKKYDMLKRFTIVWIIYWLIFFIQPVQSQYENIILAFFIQLLFLLAVAFSYFLGAQL